MSVAPCTLPWPRKMLAPPPATPILPSRQLQDAEGAHIGGADRVLGRAHAPDQRAGRLLRGEDLGDLALQLLAGHAGDPLDLLRVSTSRPRRGSRPCRRRAGGCTPCPPSHSRRCARACPRSAGCRCPGACGHIRSAWAAVRVKRGSTTIRCARFSSLPRSTCCSETGCASAGLPPMMIMVLGVVDVVVAVGHARRSPRCWRRRRPWWSGRCAPGGRPLLVPQNAPNLRNR